jgi:hypothetical protein
MINYSASVGVSDAGSNLFEVPFLRVQVRPHGFSEKVGAVAVEGLSQLIQSGHFV